MRITVLTLFPEMYRDFVSTSIIGRAIERGLVTTIAMWMISHLVEDLDK